MVTASKAMTMTSSRKQSGVALITVMLIVALAVILATEMTMRLRVQMVRTDNIQLNQQAYWYAMGAEAFAKRVLSMSNEDEPDNTNLGQQWAQGYSSFPVEYGEVSGGISDLHACLNLNALRQEPSENNANKGPATKIPARLALERLIAALDVEGISEFEAEYMADALTDWLDEDSGLVSAGGAEDNDYAGREFPYFAANNYLSSVNELRVIEHFTVDVIQALKPYVCVIPESNSHKININTLDPEKPILLQSLLGISTSEAEDILAARDEKGYQDVNDFLKLTQVTKLNLSDELKQQFVVDSEYFTLAATASFNGSFFTLNSIMKIEKDNKIRVLGRTIGRL